MQIGDIVAVVDPAAPRRGMWGLLSDTTRAGEVVVTFVDGSVETMDPFQVEDYAGLASAAVIVRQALPVRRLTPRVQPAVRSGSSPAAGSCRCGHPQHKHRQYRGYVACTCLDAPRRQCHCRGFRPLSTALESVLRGLFDSAA